MAITGLVNEVLQLGGLQNGPILMVIVLPRILNDSEIPAQIILTKRQIKYTLLINRKMAGINGSRIN
jgi:hypothetical protein